MSKLIVNVLRIEKINKHFNADNLEIAIINGWQCIVPKGKYKDGDKIVYIPVDSIIPQELSDKVGITKYLSNGRVRCAKLRGEYSFGVILESDPSWDVGKDVADILGITKYIPPVKISMGDADSNHPLLFKYTSIENLRNFPNIFNNEEDVVLTEKIHGTNVKCAIIDGVEMASSMEVRRKRPECDYSEMKNNIYWFPFSIDGVRNLLLDFSKNGQNIIIYGEVFGSQIQDLNYGKIGELGFRAFDISINGKYQNFDDFISLCKKYNIDTVPIIAKGKFSLDFVKANSCGKTTLNASHIREGVVVKPIIERSDPKIGRVILKYISDEYLLKKSDGKVSDSQDI